MQEYCKKIDDSLFPAYHIQQFSMILQNSSYNQAIKKFVYIIVHLKKLRRVSELKLKTKSENP